MPGDACGRVALRNRRPDEKNDKQAFFTLPIQLTLFFSLFFLHYKIKENRRSDYKPDHRPTSDVWNDEASLCSVQETVIKGLKY